MLINHNNLSNLILKNFKKLESCLGIGKINPISKECQLFNGDRIDLLFTVDWKNCFIQKEKLIIELKTDEARHDIIGQILKYKKYFYDRFPLNHFYCTICPSYDKQVLETLKENNIIPIKFGINNEDNICFENLSNEISFDFLI